MFSVSLISNETRPAAAPSTLADTFKRNGGDSASLRLNRFAQDRLVAFGWPQRKVAHGLATDKRLSGRRRWLHGIAGRGVKVGPHRAGCRSGRALRPSDRSRAEARGDLAQGGGKVSRFLGCWCRRQIGSELRLHGDRAFHQRPALHPRKRQGREATRVPQVWAPDPRLAAVRFRVPDAWPVPPCQQEGAARSEWSQPAHPTGRCGPAMPLSIFRAAARLPHPRRSERRPRSAEPKTSAAPSRWLRIRPA